MGSPLRVRMIPDYSAGNPYQRLLKSALKDEGVEVDLCSPSHPHEMLRWRGDIDILHVHWFPFWFSPSWRGTARRIRLFLHTIRMMKRQGIRMVYTVHNLQDHENALRGWWWRVLEQWGLRQWAREVDGWVFHCSAGRAHFPESQTRPTVIWPHIDLTPAYPPLPSQREARERLGIPLEYRILLAFGQIRPYKALNRWVEILQEVEGVALWVVGVCKLPGGCEHLRRPRVHVIEGFIPDRNLPLYVAASDALLVPQPRMLTSGVAALGMGWGRPVVVPRTGCNPETVPPEAGWFFDPDHISHWKAVLQSLASLPTEEMERMGQHGRRWMKRWQVQDMAKALKTFYLDVMKL